MKTPEDIVDAFKGSNEYPQLITRHEAVTACEQYADQQSRVMGERLLAIEEEVNSNNTHETIFPRIRLLTLGFHNPIRDKLSEQEATIERLEKREDDFRNFIRANHLTAEWDNYNQLNKKEA